MSHDQLTALLKPFDDISVVDVDRLSRFIEFPAGTLLHAGPAYDSIADVPLAVRQAGAQVLVLDGVGKSIAHALELIESGAVVLMPAQDFGVVTPLAQVVSQHSWVIKASNGKAWALAVLVEGPAPALRFGSISVLCLASMKALDADAVALKAALNKSPVSIQSVIQSAIRDGDECHAVTKATHAHFIGALSEISDRLRDKPWFVLPVVMAVCSVALKSAGFLAAVGGNGVDFGWRAVNATKWMKAKALPPVGQRFDNQLGQSVLGAIGDSAVIDFAGLGAQALKYSTEMMAVWALDEVAFVASAREDLVDSHTGMVCPNRITLSQQAPAVHLAMVDANGSGALLGRGIFQPPIELFELHLESYLEADGGGTM